MAYISFDSIRSPDYVGTLSAVKVVYPLRESFDSMYMHHYKYDSKVQHEQLIVYQTEEELLRLGAWLARELGGNSNVENHQKATGSNRRKSHRRPNHPPPWAYHWPKKASICTLKSHGVAASSLAPVATRM